MVEFPTVAGGSSNGRTADSESVCGGSNPSPPASDFPKTANQAVFLILKTRADLRTGLLHMRADIVKWCYSGHQPEREHSFL
jgi:hypothetical protein